LPQARSLAIRLHLLPAACCLLPAAILRCMPFLLETDRLIVRPYTLDDAEAAFAFFGDPEVTRYLGYTGEPHPDLETTRQRLTAHAAAHSSPRGLDNWAVIEKSTGMLIGGGGLAELDESVDVEVFYHLRVDRWGNGYATELTRALIAYAFETLELPRVVGLAYTANTASQRVMMKAGMTHLGLRHAFGHDMEYFEIIRPS
jgi:[ribosomal protein S5]-alanine N-acetyltransferase